VLVTEQNPRGLPDSITYLYPLLIMFHVSCQALGPTASEIDITALGPLHIGTFQKTQFSMFTPEVEQIVLSRGRDISIILFGIEVCKLQISMPLPYICAGTRMRPANGSSPVRLLFCVRPRRRRLQLQ
jgi:hypothetical protein